MYCFVLHVHCTLCQLLEGSVQWPKFHTTCVRSENDHSDFTAMIWADSCSSQFPIWKIANPSKLLTQRFLRVPFEGTDKLLGEIRPPVTGIGDSRPLTTSETELSQEAADMLSRH